MNFLNDKKNLPIIIAIAAVVIIGAVVTGLYFTGVIGQPAQAPVVASAPTGPSSPGYVPPTPGMPPGMAPGAPGMPPTRMAGGPGAMMQHGPGGPTGIQPGATPGSLSLGAGPSAGEHRLPAALTANKHNTKLIGQRRPAKGPGAMGMPGGPGAPAGPGGPGAPAGPGGPAGAGAKLASAIPNPNAVVFSHDPTVGPDPFYTKAPPRDLFPKTTRFDTGQDPIVPLPPIDNTQVPNPVQVPIINGQDPNVPGTAPEVNDTLRRVSGILHSSDGVFAVLETNGVSQTVQPGDDVGGAKVVAIQNDGVTLKTDDTPPLTLHVPLSDTAAVVNK